MDPKERRKVTNRALELLESSRRWGSSSLAWRVACLEVRAEKLEEEAGRDFLTGLLPRGRILPIGEREVARTRRTGLPTTILMLDVDRFKAVNDQHGHLAGDEVLRQIGRVVGSMMRKTDAAGRYGGEELMLVLSAADERSGTIFADRIRAKIRRLEFPGFRVTVSIGVATVRKGQELQEGIKRADEALYRAKRNGRDRTDSN